MNVNRRKIRQIIPAEGWWATYKDKKDPQAKIVLIKLSCWALVADDSEDTDFVIGMDGYDYVDFCDDTKDHTGYLYFAPGEPTPK